MGPLTMFKATWRPLRASEMLVDAMMCGHPGCDRLATAVAVEEIVPPDGKYRCDDHEHRHPLVIGSNPAGSATFKQPPGPMAVVVRYNPGSSAADVLQDLETHLFEQEGVTLMSRKLLVKASLRFVRHLRDCGHGGVDVVLPAGVNLRGVEVKLATGSIVVVPWPVADDEELNVYAHPIHSQPDYVLRPKKVEPPGGIAVDMRRSAEMERKDAPDPDGPTLGEMNAILRGAVDAIPRGATQIPHGIGNTTDPPPAVTPTDLQAGDVVRLRSGGPDMTIRNVFGKEVACDWFQALSSGALAAYGETTWGPPMSHTFALSDLELVRR